MYTNKQVCEKIQSVISDMGDCGKDLNVSFDKEEKAWVVDFKKGDRHLKTFLEPEDANACMEDNQCIGLGFQMHQLKTNIKERVHTG